MRGAHKTWLLDDGDDPKLAQLALRLGAGYLTRPHRQNAKAGNINAALARTTGDIIVIFDIDHIPQADFLEQTLSFFANPRDGDPTYQLSVNQPGRIDVQTQISLARVAEFASGASEVALYFIYFVIALVCIGLFIVRSGAGSGAQAVQWALVILLLLGVAVRLWAAWDTNQHLPDTAIRLAGDEAGYDFLASELLQGNFFQWPGRTPIYPLFLAAVYWAFGHSYAIVLYIQAIAGATAVPLTYLLARRFMGARSALFAAALIALHPTLILQVTRLYTEAIYTPMLLGAIMALYWALERPRPSRFTVAGALLGLITLCRPTTLLWPLSIPFLLRGSWRFPLRIIYTLVYLVSMIAVIAPWTYHNYRTYGIFMPLSVSTALLWQGSPEFYHLMEQQPTFNTIWQEQLNPDRNGGYDPFSIEGDQYFNERALASIKAEPMVYAKYTLQKLAYFWIGHPTADWPDYAIFNLNKLIDNYPAWQIVGIYITRLLPIAALIAAIALYRRLKPYMPILMLCGYFTLIHGVTFGNARHSEPLQPLLVILIVQAVTMLWQRIPQRYAVMAYQWQYITTLFTRLPRSHFYAYLNIRRTTALLLSILLLAATLRFYQVTQPFVDAFSWRQVSVAMMAENYYRTNWNIFYPEVNWSGPGPNYQGREFQTVSYMAALLFAMVGQYDWIGRTVAIVFGLWGICALYLLVRRLSGVRRALATAAMMAVLPGSVIVDRSFLPDPAMVALVVTCLWLLVAYLQTDRTRYLIAAGIIGAWGFCTKIPGLIVGLPALYAAVAILRARPANWRPKTLKLVVCGVLTLVPVAAYYLWARHLALTYPPYHFAGDGNWLWDDGLSQWLAQSYFWPKLKFHLTTWLWTLPVMALAGVGLFLWPRTTGAANAAADSPNQAQIGAAPWFFHWWLAAGLIYYAFGAKELVDNPWNLHILSPAIAALAGAALVWIVDFFRDTARPQWGALATAIVLCLVIYSGYRGANFVYRPYADEDYRLGLAVQQISQPGDLVVSVGSGYGDPTPLYYSGRRGWGFPPPALDYDWMRFPDDDHAAIGMLAALRDRGANWFVIVDQHYRELWRDHPTFLEYLDQHCVFKEQNSAGVICQIASNDQVVQAPNLPRPVLTDADYVMQEIRYNRPETDAVSLVWGVNGWNLIAETLRPADTIIKNKVMYTSMARQGEQFVTTVRVPAGTVIDYGFLVTQMQDGASHELWDAPAGRDYQTVADADQVIEIGDSLGQPTVVAAPAASYPLPIMLMGLGLGVAAIGTALFMRRHPELGARLEALAPRRWIYVRDLLHELVVRDLKLRYRRSLLGFAWSVLNPLLQVLVFSFVFRYVLPLQIPNYTLYLFIGLLVWNWLQTSLLGATASIVESGNLIKRPGFPAAILPIVTISANLIHFLLALPIVWLFLLWAGIVPNLAIVALPAVVALQFLFTLSLAYFLATVHVTLRDTQHLITVGLLLGFYLTPIFYDAQSIPTRYQTLYALNPIVHLVNAYRAILLNNELPAPQPLFMLAGISVLLLFYGYCLFTRASYRFVEEL
ncbi:MAG: glycosyltransferase family 39 protein [Caldilineaceae bacterium]